MPRSTRSAKPASTRSTRATRSANPVVDPPVADDPPVVEPAVVESEAAVKARQLVELGRLARECGLLQAEFEVALDQATRYTDATLQRQQQEAEDDKDPNDPDPNNNVSLFDMFGDGGYEPTAEYARLSREHRGLLARLKVLRKQRDNLQTAMMRPRAPVVELLITVPDRDVDYEMVNGERRGLKETEPEPESDSEPEYDSDDGPDRPKPKSKAPKPLSTHNKEPTALQKEVSAA